MLTKANAKPKISKRPNVMPICLAAFFNDMGSDMLFAFYPLFLVLILGVEEMKLLGAIESIALFCGLLIRPLTGFFADRRGRRHFIWVGYLSLMVSRVTQGLAQIWWHLVPPKVLYEVGRGVRNPPREALLSESVPRNERGFAFGLLDSMDTLGAIVGPLLGLAFFYLFLSKELSESLSYRLIFFIASLPTMVSVFLITTKTREVRAAEGLEADPEEAERQTIKGGSSFTEQKVLLIFTIISCLFAFWAVTENFMLVCAAKILRISRETRAYIWPVVLLYWFINITFAPSALYSGKLSDKRGRKLPVQISFVIMAILTLGFAFVAKYWQIGLLFALHGIYQGFLKPSQKALVADLSPSHVRATALGTYSMATGIAAIPAPLIFGLLWDWSGGWKLPFLISGAWIALCALLLSLFVHEPRESVMRNA